MTPLAFTPIGFIHSCFPEKFGIPRQPGLVPEAQGYLEVYPPYSRPEAFRGLDGFSHLWILFVFHKCRDKSWKATVRPPRLGGNRKVGVFASRSGFRPNPIGQSVVKLLGMERRKEALWLHLGGIDLVDGTPVLDLKPYLPYVDSVPGAVDGYAGIVPARKRTVHFTEEARQVCNALAATRHPDLATLIGKLLAQDPRPAYRGDQPKARFGMRLYDLNIRFSVAGDAFLVEAIIPGPETNG